MKVVVFVAHPDDEVLGMGGTILKHSQKGDFVKVVYLATGITSRRSTNFQNNVSYEQNENKINEMQKEIKDLRNDAKRSCNILKVKDCKFYDFKKLDTMAVLKLPDKEMLEYYNTEISMTTAKRECMMYNGQIAGSIKTQESLIEQKWLNSP